MEPFSISMLLAAAAGGLGNEAVKDVYNVTKQAIKDLFGKEEDLLEALDDIEAKPQSNVRRETFEKQLEKTQISQSQEVLEHLLRLEALLVRQGVYVSPTYSGKQSGSGGLAQGSGAVAAGNQGMAAGRDIIIHPTPADPAHQAKHRYLQRLIHEFQILPLAAMGGGDDLTGEVTLDQVYIELETQTPRENRKGKEKPGNTLLGSGPGEPREHERFTVLEVVTETKKVLLLGGPGSGKSTFAKELCAKIAQANLRQEDALEGWDPETLPLFFVLRLILPELIKCDLKDLSAEQQSHVLTDVVLQVWLMQFQQDREKMAEVLEESLHSGKALLVFDGVDEVPVEQRPRVYRAVMAVLAQNPNLPHVLVTCRSRSYTGPDMLPGFAPHHLAPFHKDQIRQFIQAWYTAQQDLDVERRNDLVQDLQANALGPLAELSPNPVLLTIMALLHRKGMGLPKERVKLYDLAVTVMLQRWEKEKNTAPAGPIRALLEDDRRLRDVLESIAHHIHEKEGKPEPDSNQKSETKTTQQGSKGINRYVLLPLLEKSEILGTLAAPFLDYVDQRAGLLTGDGGGEGGIPQTYSFPHRTFQEYLAGCQMIKGRRFWQAYQKRAGEGDYWSVAAQLGVEELWFNRRNQEALLDLAYELCPKEALRGEAHWRGVLWAGMVAGLVGSTPFEGDREHPRGGRAFLDLLKQRLLQLMRKSPLPPFERAEAGRHVGKLGDPRFRPEAWWLPDEPLLGFVEIRAGSFQMGETGKTVTIEIPYPYYIARYPVTQAQFQAFVDEGGYQEEAFWPEARAADVWKSGTVQGSFEDQPRHQPKKFRDPFDLPTHPVVGITWYEALAYCRWLTQKLREWAHTPEPLRTLLRTGDKTGTAWAIMLPNEPEWEKAARGTQDDRRYPWGEEADPDRANYQETNIGATSAVGCFSQGSSPYGIEEMSGNVWEWTRSVYEAEPYPRDCNHWVVRESLVSGPNQDRVWRGGSWYDEVDLLRCAVRLRDYPAYRYLPKFRSFPAFRNLDVGFRVVVSPFALL